MFIMTDRGWVRLHCESIPCDPDPLMVWGGRCYQKLGYASFEEWMRKTC